MQTFQIFVNYPFDTLFGLPPVLTPAPNTIMFGQELKFLPTRHM